MSHVQQVLYSDAEGFTRDFETGLYLGNYSYPYNAGGTENWRGGLTWVGEAGPELVALPQGSSIYSNQESMNRAGTVNNYYINVNGIDELNEVVNWYNSRQLMERMA